MPEVESFDVMDESDAIYMREDCEGIWIYLVPLGYQALEENLMHLLLWMTSLDTLGSYF